MLLRCLLPKSLLRKRGAGNTSANLSTSFMTESGSLQKLAADKAKKEYDSLLKSAHSQLKDIFLTFNQKEDRVDSFYASIMSENASFKSCWEIFKIVFTLSHGQASVERGFSINKELLGENLKEESVVCQRCMIMSAQLENPSTKSKLPVQ